VASVCPSHLTVSDRAFWVYGFRMHCKQRLFISLNSIEQSIFVTVKCGVMFENQFSMVLGCYISYCKEMWFMRSSFTWFLFPVTNFDPRIQIYDRILISPPFTNYSNVFQALQDACSKSL
jgi:hypothetical protein